MPTADRTDFHAVPDLEGVSIVRRTGSVPTGARHMHESLCVGAVVDGERALSMDGATVTVRAGEVMVLPPGRVHACVDAGESRYVMFAISVSVLERLGFDPSGLSAGPVRVVDYSLYKGVLCLAELAVVPASPLEREAALLDVLGRLPRSNDAESGGVRQLSPEVEAARACIEDRFREDLRLETLASLAGISPWRLNRNFARQVGMPPHEYQNQMRVREVKRLVVAGTSLAQAAAEVGYSDQSHMTRCFRKVMGMTPGSYARGVEGKQYH